MSASLAARLARHLRPGALVAIGDGVGAPLGLGHALAEAAAAVGGVRLLLGWCLARPVEWTAAFTDARTIMGGYALREPLRDGRVRYVPTRLGSVPALLAGRLRPDVVIASLAPSRHGGVFGTEVAWLPAAIDAGARVLAEINHALPLAAGGRRPSSPIEVVDEVERDPIVVPLPTLTPTMRTIGARVAALVPIGAELQLGPGWIGEAVAQALDRPVAITSGVVTDAVVDLDERGMLIGTPRAAYLAGTERLYAWCDGRSILRRVEESHDAGALACQRPFVAVNTALEIDRTGQVNVEATGGDALGGLGGHPDFALAASRSPGGLSIVALPSRHGDKPTLVDRLTTPTSTPRCDIDVVVTELGLADLRGLSDNERSEALTQLWSATPTAQGPLVGAGRPR